MNRRGFFSKTVRALALMPLIPYEVAKRVVANGGYETVGRLPGGSTIVDIIFGFKCTPSDRTAHVEFFRRSLPIQSVLSVPLNTRATFRWCAAPGQEIVLADGDALEWKMTAYPEGSIALDELEVHTQGHDRATGRLIIDQKWYAPNVPSAT